MATVKEIAEKKNVPAAVVRKACHELGFDLPRGKGKSFDATVIQEKRIIAKIDEDRAAK